MSKFEFDRARKRLEHNVATTASVLICNLCIGVILIEAPRMYWIWLRGQYLFGVKLCQYLWICHAIPEIFALQTCALYCYQIRKTTSNSLGRTRPGIKTFLVLLIPFLMTLLITLSRLYQPTVGSSAALQEFPMFGEKSFCPSQTAVYSWWYITFRWIAGFLLPLSTSISFLIDHRRRFWKKKSPIEFYFCACILALHLNSQSPLLIIHFYRTFVPTSEEYYLTLLQYLAVTLSKIHLSLFPIATMCFLPRRTPPPVKDEDLLELQFLYRQGQGQSQMSNKNETE